MTTPRSILGLISTIPVLLAGFCYAQELPTEAAPPAPPALPVEVIDPAPYLPGFPLWVGIIAALLFLVPLILLLLWACSTFRKSPTALHKRKKPAIEIAREQLALLEQLPEDTPLAEISTRLSILLRQYLAVSKADSALYQTREEFLTDEERLRDVPEPEKGQTADFLSNLANLQYAPPARDQETVSTLLAEGATILNALDNVSLTNSASQQITN